MNPSFWFLILERSFSDAFVISTPSNVIVPLVGVSRIPIMFKSVLFPEPEGPTIAMNSPRPIVRLTLSRAFILTPSP